jgi:hypothetical protein
LLWASLSEWLFNPWELLSLPNWLSAAPLRSQDEKIFLPTVMLPMNRQTSPNINTAIALRITDSFRFTAGTWEEKGETAGRGLNGIAEMRRGDAPALN